MVISTQGSERSEASEGRKVGVSEGRKVGVSEGGSVGRSECRKVGRRECRKVGVSEGGSDEGDVFTCCSQRWSRCNGTGCLVSPWLSKLAVLY